MSPLPRVRRRACGAAVKIIRGYADPAAIAEEMLHSERGAQWQ